jgi:VanZ family protein
MIPFKKYIPGIAWFFFVLILLCLPGSKFPKVDNFFDKIFFDKWVHAGLFCVLAFLWMWPIGKSEKSDSEKQIHFIRIALAAILWGITTEFIQKYILITRAFDLLDWAADSLGVLIAFLFCKRIYLSKK